MENTNIMPPVPQDTVLKIHIEHTKPIEVSDFIKSLNAVNSLYTSFARRSGEGKDVANSKLYVEKITEGSVIVYFCELVTANLIPFVENFNAMFEFAGYLKRVLEYFARGKGEKPQLNRQECINFKDVVSIVSADNGGQMTIGAVSKTDQSMTFHNCTFNFSEGNSTQNQLARIATELSEQNTVDDIFRRVLMQVYQIRNDAGASTGNKAIIDDIAKGKKVALVFESDELRDRILFSEANPTQKMFQVDVKTYVIDEKIKAYKVIALHDIIDIE